MDAKTQKIIEQYSNIPKKYLGLRLDGFQQELEDKKEIQEWYDKFGTQKFTPSLIFYSNTLSGMGVAKPLAIALLLTLLGEEKTIPPVYYLPKTQCVDYFRRYRWGRTQEDDTKFKQGELYFKANLIVFDGIDNLYDKEDKKIVENFVEKALYTGVPFIFISSNKLDDAFIKRRGEERDIQNLISTIHEFSEAEIQFA